MKIKVEAYCEDSQGNVHCHKVELRAAAWFLGVRDKLEATAKRLLTCCCDADARCCTMNEDCCKKEVKE